MSKDFLSQEEVDALLQGVSTDGEAPQGEADSSGVRPYNLATQERIVRGRMPTLELINERFARLFRIGLSNFVRRNGEVAVGTVRTMKYSDFLRNLVVPSNLNLVQMKPLRGTALFVFDASLIFQVVDNFFGGDGRFQTSIDGRDFTLTEQRIIQRLLDQAFESYGQSWLPVYPLEFECVRAETQTHFVTIATPNDVVLVTAFHIAFGDHGGDLHICVPYSMIEPIRDLLASNQCGEPPEADQHRVRLFSRQMQAAEVEVVADLAKTRVTLQQIAGMQVGDVISIEIPESIVAKVDGVPMMECRYGVANGQYALRVDRMLGSTAGE